MLPYSTTCECKHVLRHIHNIMCSTYMYLLDRSRESVGRLTPCSCSQFSGHQFRPSDAKCNLSLLLLIITVNPSIPHLLRLRTQNIMYRLDAEVEETTLFREPRALGCQRPERSEGATNGSRGSLNRVVSETTHLTRLDYCTRTHTIGRGILNG